MDLRPHQVVLTVSDLPRAVEFYAQLGFEPGAPIVKADGRERIAMRSRGGDFELKLFTNPDPAPLEAGDLRTFLGRVGTRYLSLLCRDVDEFYDRNKSNLEFVRPPATGMTGCRYAFFEDPDGILLEVYQPDYAETSQVQHSPGDG